MTDIHDKIMDEFERRWPCEPIQENIRRNISARTKDIINTLSRLESSADKLSKQGGRNLLSVLMSIESELKREENNGYLR